MVSACQARYKRQPKTPSETKDKQATIQAVGRQQNSSTHTTTKEPGQKVADIETAAQKER